MSKKWNNLVLVFVILALIHLVLETTPFIFEKYQKQLIILDGLITSVFLIDFYLKIKKIREEKTPFKSNFFELLIDLFSILPFFISLFFTGLKIMSALRLLRMLRILKLMNLVKSHSLIINAMKNKKHELNISMQVVLIITIILSAILYFVENPSQPENFSSITDAFLWSLSKFIGEIGGYGDFAPVTISGKILATFVGILGIAIFAVPAGIIASGFVEEIEQVKKNDELEDVYETLVNVFQFNILAEQRAKSSIGLNHLRRRFITVVDATVKLYKNESVIFDVCSLQKNLKLTKRLKPSGDEEILIEYFENNSIYGTFINRNSKITIISPHSNDGFNHGHYTYCLAEYLGANYISVEKYGMYSFFEENNINFSLNEFYKQDIEDISNPIFNSFLHDVNEIVQNGSYVFNVGSSMANSPSFHLLTGLKKGELSLSPNGTFLEFEKAQAILDDLTERSNTLNYEITTCSHYGNSSEDHIDWYISRKLGASSMSIKVNIELMKGSHDSYYQSIGFLGDSIKKNCV